MSEHVTISPNGAADRLAIRELVGWRLSLFQSRDGPFQTQGQAENRAIIVGPTT